jgi:hypothetical protein
MNEKEEETPNKRLTRVHTFPATKWKPQKIFSLHSNISVDGKEWKECGLKRISGNKNEALHIPPHSAGVWIM